jgi:hypothetical protein
MQPSSNKRPERVERLGRIEQPRGDPALLEQEDARELVLAFFFAEELEGRGEEGLPFQGRRLEVEPALDDRDSPEGSSSRER